MKLHEVLTIFLSKVGDNSIDIPEANVIIQISSHGGSRRQEAQRLGRILRPKCVAAKENMLQEKAGVREHNAFFYSLVSTDTEEMYFSTKRQQFLIQQGYAFKVVSNIIDEGVKYNLLFSTCKEQIYMLERLIRLDEATAGEEVLEEDEDDITGIGNHSDTVKRREDSMLALSGAQGTYLEYHTRARG